jgi:carboxymethylenebutenolidase
MCLDYEKQEGSDKPSVSRRTFGALSLAAGAAAATVATGASAAALDVMEMDVTIKTADGNAEAVLVHPKSGTHPAVIIWVDALGLRPAFRDMAKRLAGEGYVVLAHNPYYRVAKVPVLPADFSFSKPEDRAKIGPLMAGLTQDVVERDATALVEFLGKQSMVKKGAKIGTQGYCMGGRLTMITAAKFPDRIGAAGSFHGGGLATDKPDSPHLMAPKIKAKYLFAVAKNDDAADPAAKDTVKKAFADAKNPAEVEVYAADHGWCVPDMPAYNKEEAERAWTRLLALYKSALV